MKSMKLEMSNTERLYSLIAMLIGIMVLLGLVGQFIIIADKAPPQAVVYTDQNTGIYYAPPYILGKKYPSDFDESNLQAETVAEAAQKGHKADKACVDLGYFKQRSTLNDRIMITIGLAEKPPSRWNADGSWNW